MKKWIGILFILLWSLAPLAVAGAGEQGGLINIFEILQKERMDTLQAFKITPLLAGSHCSFNLVQLSTVVKSHYHQSHDEVVYIVRGNGLVTIAGKEYQVWPGYAYLVPQGTIHRFVNLGPDTAVVLSIFSPAFDGQDRIFVEE